jgi:hypothetical protein
MHTQRAPATAVHAAREACINGRPVGSLLARPLTGGWGWGAPTPGTAAQHVAHRAAHRRVATARQTRTGRPRSHACVWVCNTCKGYVSTVATAFAKAPYPNAWAFDCREGRGGEHRKDPLRRHQGWGPGQGEGPAAGWRVGVWRARAGCQTLRTKCPVRPTAFMASSVRDFNSWWKSRGVNTAS